MLYKQKNPQFNILTILTVETRVLRRLLTTGPEVEVVRLQIKSGVRAGKIERFLQLNEILLLLLLLIIIQC